MVGGVGELVAGSGEEGAEGCEKWQRNGAYVWEVGGLGAQKRRSVEESEKGETTKVEKWGDLHMPNTPSLLLRVNTKKILFETLPNMLSTLQSEV